MKYMNTRSKMARVGLFFALSFFISESGKSQSSSSFFILPTFAENITISKSLAISQELETRILTRTNLEQVDQSLAKAFQSEQYLRNDFSRDELIDIGSGLLANYIFIPEIDSSDTGLRFKVSNFDTDLGEIVKVVAQDCECDFNQIQQFPYRRLVDLLFESTDLELAAELPSGNDSPSLPPPISALPVLPDTSRNQNNTNPENNGFGWKKYAASALVVSSGILYLVANKDDEGNSNSKLSDPPPPPGE